jgi:hypothetical protein
MTSDPDIEVCQQGVNCRFTEDLEGRKQVQNRYKFLRFGGLLV